jgi:hypothetical protein
LVEEGLVLEVAEIHPEQVEGPEGSLAALAVGSHLLGGVAPHPGSSLRVLGSELVEPGAEIPDLGLQSVEDGL